VVVGDATLDVIVRAAADPAPGADLPAEIRLEPGGQGANVAVRLARAGVATRLVCALGTDPAGRMLGERIAAEGVELSAAQVPRSGVVVSVVVAGERTMRSDRASLPPVDASALAGVHWVHVSGYPLADDESGDALAATLGRLADGVRLSVGGAPVRGAGHTARFRDRLATAGVDLLFLGGQERAALNDGDASGLAAITLVTDGARGSRATWPRLATPIEVPAAELPGATLDPTGAGDAYAAGVIAALLGQPWPPGAEALRAAMRRGSLLGAQVARVIGAQGVVE
jgi:sugar/nucleoside kinase (ribokinase family)